MLKILSLHDFEGPVFGDTAAVGLIEGVVHYCTYEALQDEMQPFAKYLRGYPEVSVTQEILATRETARMISAGDLFLPVHDTFYYLGKKEKNEWPIVRLCNRLRLYGGA